MWVSLTALAGTHGVLAAHPWIAASPLFTAFLLLYVSGQSAAPPRNSRQGVSMADTVHQMHFALLVTITVSRLLVSWPSPPTQLRMLSPHALKLYILCYGCCYGRCFRV